MTQIGLLLAGQYQPRPDFFGLMFDEDFVPGTSNPWVSTPREGCAVFLTPISARRSGGDFIDEVIYPHSTRRRIALGLRKLRNKSLENPWKKHDNIPL